MNEFFAKVMSWKDDSLLKWSCALFGIALGIYLDEEVRPYLLLLLMFALAFAVKPAVDYFRE